ncbi:DUF1692-domain-containing protein [Atractiella rhizophila]|nr:DUF1692-domain-containing protein [Atractiella rhizophila]KAH8918573.1 DUF1692-domain-containing protein [Atractiella rhizophila]
MARGLFAQSFRGLDAFGKTMEDVKVKTGFGGMLTLFSFCLILALTLIELLDYRRITLRPSIVVDKSRGEKLSVSMNITFPRVPCYLLSIDIMDISGEHQNDVNHDITKTRLDQQGNPVEAVGIKGLKGEFERVAASNDPNYCGSCYGGAPPASGCCNTCEEVREAYVRRGWSFVNPDSVDQCVKEGWTDKIAKQNTEGCNVAGLVRVNKVIGNFHLSPGRSFQSNAMHVHDLVPYLQGGKQHDFGHIIHRFSFGTGQEGGYEDDSSYSKQKKYREQLGIVNPLDGLRAHTEESNYMFQYFLKVVGTKFKFLNGEEVGTHQYSVTQYERDLSSDSGPMDAVHHTSHGYAGVPGVFFSYEISPMLVTHAETRESLAHFLSSTCAIVGGVLTVAGMIDKLVYSGRQRLKLSGKSEGMGFASASGKFL